MGAVVGLTSRESLESFYGLNPQEIDALAWVPVEDCPGVSQKVLWHLGGFVQALLHYQPGASSLGKPHLAAHHHIWVVSGAATIAGRRLLGGSYMHVPPGTQHPVQDVGPEGCTLLQMHRPHPPREAEALVLEA